jgi:hypothetical protein
MIKNNSVHLIFFSITFLFLVFVSVKQVVVSRDHVPFSYKQLLSPKTFFKSLSVVNNDSEYSVSLEDIDNHQSKLSSYLEDKDAGYEFTQAINISTDNEMVYFSGTNDHEVWDLLSLNIETNETEVIKSGITYVGEKLTSAYQPIFKKIAFPVCVKGGCDINVIDVESKEIIQIKPTIISSIPDDRAEFISNFFYDETANFVGYKNDNLDDNKFYTIDLSIESQAGSSMQIVYLETAGQDFEFMFYYPESKMMLFRSDKKQESQSNHPDTEYFLYAANRPALVLVDVD